MDVDKLRAFDDMFQSNGWKYLIEEVSDELENVTQNIVHAAPNFEQICLYRGQLFQLNKLVTLEETLIMMVQMEAAEDKEEEDADLLV